MDERIRRARVKARQLAPILAIGKNGIGEGTVSLIKRELDQKRLIKIKLLKAALAQYPRDELVHEIVRTTGSVLVHVVGNVVVLGKQG